MADEAKNPPARRAWLTGPALLAALALPSGAWAWLDGLPWSSRVETCLLAGALPFLIIVHRRFLAARWALRAALLLLALKLVLAFLCPEAGWEVRAYEDPAAHQAGRWERTYASLLRPGLSARLTRPWTHGREFPVEWLNRGPLPAGGPRPVLEVRGWARVPQGMGLALVAGGVHGGSFTAAPPEGEERAHPLAPDLGAAARLAPEGLPGGLVRVRALLPYGQGDWSLIPVLVGPGGSVRPAFKQGVLWRDLAGAELSDLTARLWGWLARGVDAGLLLFMLAWGLAALWSWWRRGLLDAPLLGLAALGLILPRWLGGLVPDPAKTLPLGMGISACALGLALVSLWRQGRWEARRGHLGRLVILVLGPGILAWFLELWAPAMGRMAFWSAGDDWLTYQNFAREIFLNRDWLDSTRPIWHVQPLYRYVVGLLHLLFGQAPVAQHLLDIWAVIGAAGLVAFMAARLGARTFWALLAAWLFLTPELCSDLRAQLARGLQEHAAMLAMLAAGAAALRWGGAGARGALLAGLLAMAGYWLRQDHLGGLAGLGVLCWEPVRGRLWPAWRETFIRLGRRWGWLAVYLACVFGAVALVGLRNWWLSGSLTLASADNLARHVGAPQPGDVLWGLRLILGAAYAGWSWPALVLAPGVIGGLLALVLRRGPLARYPLGLSIALLGTFSVYLVVVPGTSYPPRYSIHVLPLAALSLALILDAIRPPKTDPGAQGF